MADETPAYTRPDITDRLALYWRTYADLPSRALHPETPLYTHGMLIEDTRDARLEIERLRAELKQAQSDPASETTAGHIEVRRDEDGSLDEIVATGASVHLEQMGGNSWWMSIEAGGRTIHVNLTTPRTIINARCDYVG